MDSREVMDQIEWIGCGVRKTKQLEMTLATHQDGWMDRQVEGWAMYSLG